MLSRHWSTSSAAEAVVMLLLYITQHCPFSATCQKQCIDDAEKGTYQRVGEATELALRVLTEKIGLLGYAARALDSLSRVERATYCNDHWQQDYRKVACMHTFICVFVCIFVCSFV